MSVCMRVYECMRYISVACVSVSRSSNEFTRNVYVCEWTDGCTPFLSLSLSLSRSTPWAGGGAILGFTPHPQHSFGDHE